MARRRTKIQEPPPAVQQNQNQGASPGLLAGVAGASMVSNAGGTTFTSCPPEDKSFYCNFVKGFNIFKMILFIIVVLIIAFVLYKMFFGAKSAGKGKK